MTDTSQKRPEKHRHPISRLPAFTPVPLRVRKDGWTPLRQADPSAELRTGFIGVLAETRSVSAAAAFVGMSRESAYRLGRKPGGGEFVAVWDSILGTELATKNTPARPTRKVTLEPIFQRILQDRYRPVLRGGKYVGTIKKPDNRALLKSLSQFNRADLSECDGRDMPEGHRKQKRASV